jgi:diacylglycerol kinase family enzyme
MEHFVGIVRKRFAGDEHAFKIHVSAFPRDAIAHIRSRAEELREDERLKVYAVGGDGILFDCLNGVIGLPNVELGAIPYGKTNDFVRAFGDCLNEEFRDVGNQMNGKPVWSDVISVGSFFAMNTCSVGMEAYAVHRAFDLQRRFKPVLEALPRPVSLFFFNIFYYIGAFCSMNKEILTQSYTVTMDGKDYSGGYASINIANGPCYGGDKLGAVAAMPDDGLLDVIFLKNCGVFTCLTKGLDYVYGNVRKYPDYFSYHRTKEISIRSDKPLVLQLDGEIFVDTNITAKVCPRAVKIISVNNREFKRRSGFEDIRRGD